MDCERSEYSGPRGELPPGPSAADLAATTLFRALAALWAPLDLSQVRLPKNTALEGCNRISNSTTGARMQSSGSYAIRAPGWPLPFWSEMPSRRAEPVVVFMRQRARELVQVLHERRSVNPQAPPAAQYCPGHGAVPSIAVVLPHVGHRNIDQPRKHRRTVEHPYRPIPLGVLCVPNVASTEQATGAVEPPRSVQRIAWPFPTEAVVQNVPIDQAVVLQYQHKRTGCAGGELVRCAPVLSARHSGRVHANRVARTDVTALYRPKAPSVGLLATWSRQNEYLYAWSRRWIGHASHSELGSQAGISTVEDSNSRTLGVREAQSIMGGIGARIPK